MALRRKLMTLSKLEWGTRSLVQVARPVAAWNRMRPYSGAASEGKPNGPETEKAESKTESKTSSDSKEEEKTWKSYIMPTVVTTAIAGVVFYFYAQIQASNRKKSKANAMAEENVISPQELDDLRRLNHFTYETLENIVKAVMDRSQNGRIQPEAVFEGINSQVQPGMVYGFVWERLMTTLAGKDGKVNAKHVAGGLIGSTGVDDPDRLLDLIFNLYKSEGSETMTAGELEDCIRELPLGCSLVTRSTGKINSSGELSTHQVYPARQLKKVGWPVADYEKMSYDEIVDNIKAKRTEGGKRESDGVTFEEFLKIMKLDLCVWNECTKEENKKKKTELEEKKKKEEEAAVAAKESAEAKETVEAIVPSSSTSA